MLILLRIFVILTVFYQANANRPNIIFILADDLGFNDVSFHGSSQILTPNIDALAYSGVILNRYYVTPLCTPSRAALLTGKYPIHTGTQHDVILAMEPRGVSLNETLMPEYLNGLGYVSHVVGKWHLGHWKRDYTPLYRGFASHTGYWTGRHDYNDHTAMEDGIWGLDMRRGMDVAWDLHGEYTTDVITKESVEIIEKHNKDKPLFLYVSHLAVHSCMEYNPLPAPDSVVAEMSHIDDFMRRKYAAILTKLDRSVGAVVKALDAAKMLENSIIVFSTDNGGAPEGFNLNHASNWPLRGAKYNLWEGGVRGVGVIWSPLLKQQKRVSNQLMHITDWLPTLYAAAGGDINSLPKNLDGINVWETLSQNKPSPRNEILLNIDDYYGPDPIYSIISNNFKLLYGTWFEGAMDGWYGPEGDRDVASYDVEKIKNCSAGISLRKFLPNIRVIKKLRFQAMVDCKNRRNETSCDPLVENCLFDIFTDPCERNNIASERPDVVKFLKSRIEFYRKSAIPAANKELDPRGDPKLWDRTWTNFGDFLNDN